MINETFKNRQDKLFAMYHWSGLISWSLAGLAIFAASFIPPYASKANTSLQAYGPVLMWAGIVLVSFAATFRHFLKKKLQARFWDEYARILQGNQVDVTKTFHTVLAGPILKDNAQSLVLQRGVLGRYKNYPTVLQDVRVTYEKNIPGKDNATFKLQYIVQAVKLPSSVPHIFIASKERSKKKLATPSNLWSLTTKLDPAQKLQDLEGNFGTYFDVYTPHLESDGLVYKKEIDALRVLTPDVMLTLRDEGFNFDYELYENYLYVILEPDMLTAAELENFILSLDAALSELVPQLTGHKFSNDGMKLNVRIAPLTLDILFGRMVKPAKLALLVLAIIFLGTLLGNLQ